MSAKAIKQERKDVEAAIRSLYDVFPDPNIRHGCSNFKTKEIVKLQRKIKERENELEEKISKDSQLVKMKAELKEMTCNSMNRALKLHRGVDDLLRRLQVRGVSADLLEDIEKHSRETPVVTEECICDDED